MKQDIINWSRHICTGKIVSKETLNHAGIIEKVSGLNVYQNTHQAFLRAYQALGIDIINRVPVENANLPTPKGQKKTHADKPYSFTSLGVYDTAFRERFEVSTPEEVFTINMDKLAYKDLIVPVPHSCRADDIKKRQIILGETGMYYPMLYTTLFMWAVETLGWENFMISAISYPDQFHDYFLKPCVVKTKRIVEEILSASENPFVFLHDDLADANGPVFPMSWYKDYIFPHYRDIFGQIKAHGKNVMFVADGNMTQFLPHLVELGVDGLMCENPATPFEIAVAYFGTKDKFLIGGIETKELCFSEPVKIQKMVLNIADKTRNCLGFALSSCGGLHGDIPMANIEAYFDARAEIGATPKNWQHYFD